MKNYWWVFAIALALPPLAGCEDRRGTGMGVGEEEEEVEVEKPSGGVEYEEDIEEYDVEREPGGGL
ncbi:hypothetical protein [Sandaracinus amylolyticus]|uniref:hypothetical protein n=1 Tax=Sandaracinus amylolyticus TaxID=927083 RepID=UPI001F3A83D3|nr:hypothetical protein [Sandaracinus amylolyticus]UJR82889.1 Hypothetical protein I5071_49540 [Sandaracinus amylolyticus]